MADEDPSKPRPNLEPPKLFGRKKSKPAAAPTPTPAAAAAEKPAARAPGPKPSTTGGPATTPAKTPAKAAPVVKARVAKVVPVAKARATEPAETSRPLPATDDTTVFEDSSIKTAPAPTSTERPPVEADREAADDADREAADDADSQRPRLVLVGRPAAALTGLLVGGVMIGLIYLAFAGCEAVQGTTACGTAPGLGLLIVILALAIVAGTVLLRYFDVADPGSTSFLAVALVGVISMLFLVDVLDEWPMLIVIPLVSSFTFVLSWWVSITFTEPARD